MNKQSSVVKMMFLVVTLSVMSMLVVPANAADMKVGVLNMQKVLASSDAGKKAQSVIDGTFKAGFEWNGPDWKDINNPDTSAVGFVKGEGLGDAEGDLDAFIAELAGGLDLWTGPLNYQDGSAFLGDGEEATLQQIWYMPQLLEGVEGASEAEG